MTMELTWFGHATWQIKIDEHLILLDPFLDDSPTAPVKADELNANVILVSHGHFDHVADVASIANRCHSTVIAIYEIAEWFASKHSVADTIGMNIGGWCDVNVDEESVCRVKMTPAIHSSALPDRSNGGVPAGFVVAAQEKRIYFACDTALFSDMQLIGKMAIDVAVLPIGDLFTMGPEDSIEATKLINPKKVLPTHYNTWPPIEQDASAWASKVSKETDALPLVIEPGDTIEV